MPKSRAYEVEKHLQIEELKSLIRKGEREARMLKRLYFIKFLYEGDGVEEASIKAGVTKSIGYEWLRRWNREGYTGLIPKFGGGRPSKMTDVQREELKAILRRRRNLSLHEVKVLVEDRFGINYSEKQIGRILRSEGIKMEGVKP
ncbi:MAG: helix-turn-helix domain-containing protein [Halobacteriota archaeon]|nr:helix-turn-helix domain-containing protein [Halobacteriota archaeon]